MAGPEFPERFEIGGLTNTVVGPILASAATIAPTFSIHHVSGTVTISTITPPWTGFTGKICLIPDAAWALTTGGNIAAALTAVTNSPVYLEFDGTSWFNVTGLYGGAGGALSVYAPNLGFSQFTDTKAASTLILAPMQLQCGLNALSFAIHASHTIGADSNSAASASYSVQLGIYRKTGASLSIFSSTLATFSASVSSNTGTALINGLREVNLGFALNLSPGNYWYGLLYSSAATEGAGSNVFSAPMSIGVVSQPGTQSALSGLFEAAATASYIPYPGVGMMTVSTAAIPATIGLTALSRLYASAPFVIFKNYSS